MRTLRTVILSTLLMLGLPLTAVAQITIPNTFTAFTLISAARFNENFSELGTKSLNRTGGTLTGNLTVSSSVTVDGADISAYLAGGKLLASSTAADSIDVAGGITAGTGNVALVTTAGKITAITSTYFASLSFDASNLTGTITSATQDLITRTGTITSGTWSGSFGAVSGANLTSLNASNLASGTVATARLGSGTASSATYLRGDNTWVAPTGTVPTGAILLFASGACPSGYTEWTASRGYYVMLNPAGGTAGATRGTAYTAEEVRTHTHSVSGTTAGHTHGAGSFAVSGQTTAQTAGSSNNFTAGTPNELSFVDHSHGFSASVTGASASGQDTYSSTSGTGANQDIAPYVEVLGCVAP